MTRRSRKPPPGWQPTPDTRKYVEQQGCDPDEILEAMSAYIATYDGFPRPVACWDTAMKTWAHRRRKREAKREQRRKKREQANADTRRQAASEWEREQMARLAPAAERLGLEPRRDDETVADFYHRIRSAQ